MSGRDLDPITLAVISSALDTIVDEMAYTVMRTSRSPLVRDVLDYSCTLCDASGRILTQAKTVALHLGAVPDAIEVVLDMYGGTFAPGDIIILNDPYRGGMHLPDIFMFKPIFSGDTLHGFSVVITHHCDVGGRVPGSNAADSTEIFQEGLRIPPLKLYDAGKRDNSIFEIIRTNVRVPDLVIGDIESQIATCNIGERDFLQLLERYGDDRIHDYFDELIDYGEALTRKAISAWPDGAYEFTDYIDGDGFSRDQIPITCKVTVAGDHLTVDFEGSSPQVRGAINSTMSYTKSSTYLAVRCALDEKVPNNAGVYRCITVKAPVGSILNPQMPAAVAARALTGYRTMDTVMGALARAVPDKVRAAGEGGNTVVCFGGYDKETREPFIMVDMINGAWGARADADGIEGVTNPSQNMSNMPIELLEQRYPVLMEEYAFRDDSCGPGRYRGGLGLVRQYRLLADRSRPATALRPLCEPALRARRRRAGGAGAQRLQPGRRARGPAEQGHPHGSCGRRVAPRAARRRRLRQPAGASGGGGGGGCGEREDLARFRRGGLRRRVRRRRSGYRGHRSAPRRNGRSTGSKLMSEPRVVVVTGGASGIGEAVVRHFAAAGDTVCILDTNRERGEAVAGELGGKTEVHRVDTTDRAGLEAVAGAILDAHGRVDVLVPCAGILQNAVRVLDMDLEEAERLFRVNYLGVAATCQVFGHAMKRQGAGVIVNIASITSYRSGAQIGYTATKVSLNALTQAMAAELGRYGIRVNAVAPGYTLTPALEARIASGERDADAITGASALGRFVTPEDVARAIWFLASNDAAVITGVTLPVDAGWLAFTAYDTFAATAPEE